MSYEQPEEVVGVKDCRGFYAMKVQLLFYFQFIMQQVDVDILCNGQEEVTNHRRHKCTEEKENSEKEN